MAMAVHLPDEVAAQLAERADERGVTVAELVRELLERTDRRRALEALIGSVDLPVDEPFDIHRERAAMAEGLLGKHRAISDDFARRRARSPERAIGLD